MENQTGKDREVIPQQLMLDAVCPLFSIPDQSCLAAKGGAGISSSGYFLCGSDDFDHCPRLLAYLLRRSRPNRFDHDWLDAV